MKNPANSNIYEANAWAVLDAFREYLEGDPENTLMVIAAEAQPNGVRAALVNSAERLGFRTSASVIRRAHEADPRDPTTQPTTQSEIQPITQPTMQPATQPVTQPTMHLATQPVTQPISQPATSPTTQPATQLPTQPTTRPTARPASIGIAWVNLSGGDMPLGAKELASIVEGMDPLALVALDTPSAALLADAYRCAVPTDARSRILGRTCIAFDDFARMLHNDDQKQHAWALLKKLR